MCAHDAGTDRSADVGTSVTTPHWVVVGEAANLSGRQRRMGFAGSQWVGIRDVAVAGKGDGVRGGAYRAMSGSG